ncbi:Uncharacterized protein PBTT_03664 [Plasmodiophora brassicae]|uniref:Uncharacterized protein n=1 Tax=Plasmodiophora brassicae TaxID=37360 RepID=A0A0G4IS07_PLABS|nr:hypothetical protein PBRA_006149 [Plasmodiophora brassicae]SPQ96140.1 unnamed protein product [Plasmodiophora brassicae]
MSGWDAVLLLLVAVSSGAVSFSMLGPELCPWEIMEGEYLSVDLAGNATESSLDSAARDIALVALATSSDAMACLANLLGMVRDGTSSRILIPPHLVGPMQHRAVAAFINVVAAHYPRHRMRLLQAACKAGDIQLLEVLRSHGITFSMPAPAAHRAVASALRIAGRGFALREPIPGNDGELLWHILLCRRGMQVLDSSAMPSHGTWLSEAMFETDLLVVLLEHGFELMSATDGTRLPMPLEAVIATQPNIDADWQLAILSKLARRGAQMTLVVEHLIMSTAERIESALYLMETFHMRPSFTPDYIELMMKMESHDNVRRAKLILRYGGYTATLPNGMSPARYATMLGLHDLAKVFDEYDVYAQWHDVATLLAEC